MKRFLLSLLFVSIGMFTARAGSGLESIASRHAVPAASSSASNGGQRPFVPAVPSLAPAIVADTTPYVAVLPQSIRMYSSLDDFVDDAQITVNDYWLHQPFPADRPYTAPRVTLARPGELAPCSACHGQTTSFYSSSDQTIYLDPQGLTRANGWAGYAAMYKTLAHEWTHHVQFVLQVPRSAPQFELQADCGSGMFLAAGWPGMSQSDLNALRRLLSSTPSDELHGSPAQRLAAFDDGYQHGATDRCGLPPDPGSPTMPALWSV